LWLPLLVGLRALVQYRYDLPFVLSQPSPEFVVFSLAQLRRGIPASIIDTVVLIRALMGQVPGESVSHRAGIVGQQNNPSLVREHLPLEPVRVLVPVSGFSERYSLRYRYR